MANVLTFVWMTIGWVVAHSLLLLWLALVLPNPVQRAKARIEQMPGVSFILGFGFWLVNLTFSIILLNLKVAPLQFLGWASLLPLLFCAFLGGAGFASLLADRLQRRLKSDSAIVSLLTGSFFTVLPGLLPVAGWFFYLPITGFIATGAGLIGLFSRNAAAVPAGRPAAPSDYAAYAAAYPANPVYNPALVAQAAPDNGAVATPQAPTAAV